MRLLRNGKEAADVKGSERSCHRLGPQSPVLSGWATQLIEPLNGGQLIGECHPLQEGHILHVFLE